MNILRRLPVLLICLIGCGGPTIVGKWTSTASSGTATMEFTSNTFNTISDTSAMGGKMHIEASGTYTFDGKKLVMTTTNIKLPDQLKKLAPMIEQDKGKPVSIDAKLEGDKLTFSTPAGTAAGASGGAGGTFTRVK
jgi:hypothetical protein